MVTKKLSLKEKIQIINSILMVVIGILILIRLLFKHLFIPILIFVALGFFFLGLLRLYHIIKYFRNKKGSDKQ